MGYSRGNRLSRLSPLWILFCAGLATGGLAGQTVIGFDGLPGNASFNHAFKEPNRTLNLARWTATGGGPNVAGQVQVSGNQAGDVFYDTSVTPGTGGNPGTGGSNADVYQDGVFQLVFSLQTYTAGNNNNVGLFFRIDSDAVGSGNGYGIIVNPILSGGQNVFEYRFYSASHYAPSAALQTYFSTAAIPAVPSPYYTLQVTVSGSSYTAQIYDAGGNAVGGPAAFSDSTYPNAGMAGFRVYGTGTGYGASAYQFSIGSSSQTPEPPILIHVQAGASGGDGSAANPYGSITTAVSHATEPGTIVQVESRTYRGEKIVFPASGTEAQPIVLRAAPGATVVVKGSQVVATPWTALGSTGVYSTACPYYFGTWDPAFTTPGTDTSTLDARSKGRNQLFVTGPGGTPNGIPMAEVPQLSDLGTVTYTDRWGTETYAGTFYIDPASQTVYLELPDGSDPSSATVEITSTQDPLLTNQGKDWITVQDISFLHGANASQTGLVRFSGGSQCEMDRCQVYYAAGAGGQFSQGTGFVVRDCVFQWNGQEGFTASSSVSPTFTGCDTSYNNLLPNKQFDPGWEAGGNKLSATQGAIVDGHTSTGNYGPGLWFDVHNQNATIENCLMYDNATGIQYEISYTGLIVNNRCYDNWGKGIFISSSAGCLLYNNTCVANQTTGIAVYGGVRSDGAGRSVSSYANTMLNNIISLNQTTFNNLSYIVDTSTPTFSNDMVAPAPNASDYNLFFIPSTSQQENFFCVKLSSGNTLAVTLNGAAGWQTISGGLDMHSLWGDPLFANDIVRDQFTGSNGAALSGRSPDTTDLPGTSWTSSGSCTLTTGSYASSPSALQVGNAAAATIPLAAGSYSPSDTYLNVSAKLRIGSLSGSDTPSRGLFLGFASGTGSLTPGNSQFYGVIFGPTGSISLQEGSSVTLLSAYNASKLGTFSTSAYYTLSYTVNVKTGQIFNIVLWGPKGKMSLTPQTAGFTGANVACAAFYASGSVSGSSGDLDDFAVKSASDFSLSAGSPAVDAGLTIPGSIPTDALGVPRPQGTAWDIGALERN